MSRRVLLNRLWHQVLGLVFLVVAALFFATTVAVYNKAFTDVVPVRLETETVGSQLSEGADVKVRGVLVGTVRSVEATADGAALELALKPEKVALIPANVTARLLPKTLFGQRYVALQIPEGPAAQHIEAGDVIGQDRSKTAIELQEVLGDVLPLLQAVQPQKLASTLNAVATALDGRGAQLGQTLVQVSNYLGELNPSLPDLKADIAALDDVAATYNDAAPEFLSALSDLTTTTRTILEKREGLRDLYATVTGASTDLTRFLQVNKNNLINLTATAQPTLDVLAKYAPEYPCLLRQLAAAVPIGELAFGKGTAHPEVSKVTIEFSASRGPYKPGVDEHRNLDKRGPRCYPWVEPAAGNWPQYPPDGPVKDGSSHPAPPKKPDGTLPGPVGGIDTGFEPGPDGNQGAQTGGGGTPAAGVPSIANSAAERQLLSVLLAPKLGVPASDVPGWSTLLVGPVYRGTEVALR